MEVKKKFFMDCHLAGRKYHDVDEVWEQLKVGTFLRLERDADNKYDPEAVAVMYDDEVQHETYCLGYLPSNDNKLTADLLDMGWTDLIECRISTIKPDAHPEQQIRLTLKIKRNPAK